MKYLSIRVIAQSPLSIRSDHASSGAGTTSYIPGSTVLGSLATTYKLLNPGDAHNFERLFLSGAVRFPNLYLASYKKNQKLPDINKNLPIYPTPKTAIACKRQKGFLYPSDQNNESHGVRDTLIDHTLFTEWPEKDKVTALTILEASQTCAFEHNHQRCGEPTNRYEAYYRRINDKQLLASEGKYHLQTHTGINRFSGTIEEGILYNRQVFDEGTQFWGLIKVTDETVSTLLEDFLERIAKGGLMRLGTGRTRGMGKVFLITENQSRETDTFAAFQQRLDTFNSMLQQEARKYQTQLSQIEDQYYFALTLHSPTILTDALFRYHGTINARILEDLLYKQAKTPIHGIQHVYHQAQVQRITGWQELWGTPRTNEYAIETGSVFLFKCPHAQRTKLLPALYQLEEQGIGKRTIEGFGRICISDAFHQEVTWL
ncbi:RAMP superfamily CRISPR-associated protein [Dictyobacter aurantiacus]|uniref:CRISPR-associated RAMP protein Csx10 n=1 Tax=Dictyobacter aurantiacus TaxID=1936993 RepID=A0A401ZQV4_9CHLR|nr:RAMP superfamily CRISPR-associated protein [Dictyobacter aurantiacus]GCE09298.1 CRISPR-associated RAMP protein Csx10 [Dictyobacter aurantiacus]